MKIEFLKTSESMAEKYAQTLLDRWGVGYAPCNNGVVIYIAVQDRKLNIYAG